jgi:hypothetical protein
MDGIGVFGTKYQLSPRTTTQGPPFPSADELTSIINAALSTAGWTPVEIDTQQSTASS